MEDEAPKKSILARAMRLVVLLVTGIVLFGAAWMLFEHRLSSDGPVYQGKAAKEWLALAVTTNQAKAFEAFRGMGTNAVPFLLGELRRKDSSWDRFYHKTYVRMPPGIRRHLTVPPWPETIRWSSASLMLVNVRARAAMPELMQLLESGNNDQRLSVIDAIVRLIVPADVKYVPVLVQSLQSTNTYLQWTSAEALGTIGPGAKAAVPALTNLLESFPTQNVQERAVRALQRIEPRAAVKYEGK